MEPKSHQDYNCLVQSLVLLINQLASLEAGCEFDSSSTYSIEKAQRIVIKTLVN